LRTLGRKAGRIDWVE